LNENNGTNTTALIASMILERLQQKEAAKKLFNKHKPVDDNEAW
jgi:hypothetical protein